VRWYKDKLPDLGAKFVGFEKARLANPKDAVYLKKYIHEVCIGEIGHIVGGILGFAIMATMPVSYFWLSIALPCAVVNLVLAIMPIITMRYNRHKLVALLKIVEMQNKRDEAKKNKEEEGS
jgi:L-cystine uptake protein TcyP (sodium:dicarboxylate symporter family)